MAGLKTRAGGAMDTPLFSSICSALQETLYIWYNGCECKHK